MVPLGRGTCLFAASSRKELQIVLNEKGSQICGPFQFIMPGMCPISDVKSSLAWYLVGQVETV